jgi:Protein of unknown function (DUF2889)
VFVQRVRSANGRSAAVTFHGSHRPIWPGLDGPRQRQPNRSARSFRRTTTIDITVADDLYALELWGTGRDLATNEAGHGQLLETARMEARLTLGERSLTHLDAELNGTSIDLAPLLGSRAGSGFRTTIHNEFPKLASSGSLLALLLDEIPVASVISGTAVVRARERLGLTEIVPRGRKGANTDVCAGWKAGSRMTLARSGEGKYDFGERGPIVPSAEADADDPMSWHHTGPIGYGQVRRQRRMDIRQVAPLDPLYIDAWFRDSYGEALDVESGVHEYDVTAVVDPTSLVVVEVEARPRVLPAPECPLAVASAQRIRGIPLREVRDLVRASFTGPSTCTHLNDTLRAMGDLFAAIPQFTQPHDAR